MNALSHAELDLARMRGEYRERPVERAPLRWGRAGLLAGTALFYASSIGAAVSLSAQMPPLEPAHTY